MKHLLLCACLLGLAHATGAQTLGGAPPPGMPGIATEPVAPRPLAPHEMIRRGVDRLTGFLIGAANPSTEAVRAFLEREVAPHFDFAYMARWAAGPLYRRMTEEQRARLGDKLRDMFLDALARNLGSFADSLPDVEVFTTRPGTHRNEAVVPARVVTDDGLVVRLLFRFYWSGQGWRIFDVSANGASAVAYYRSHFGSLLRRYGPAALQD